MKLDKLSGTELTAFWFDPRVGNAIRMGKFSNTGTQKFEPFSCGRGNDWLLVLEDAAQKFPPPGAAKKK